MKYKGKKLTEKEYRERPELSRSELFLLNESPQKFKWAINNPEPPTESLLLGQVFHKLVLEPDDFDNEFAIEPNVDKRTKDGREQYQTWLGSIGDKSVVSIKTYEKACDMAVAVKENKMAMALLNGEHEHAYFWQDEYTGVDCKCRLDCLRELNGKPLIVDLKSAQSCNTEKWIRDSIKFGYDVQVAMYSEGIRATYGADPDFVFIVVEKEAPYAVNIFKATKEYADYGYDRYRSLLGLYKHCVDTNNWAGYMGENEQINDLTLPSWLGGKDD